jgi:L-2-hydroxyglutarate oxidase
VTQFNCISGQYGRSVSKRAFVRSLQELIPAVEADDLVPAPAGIRAQALKADGTLVDDFHITANGPCLNVCNAPSPAATASLQIGAYIASVLTKDTTLGNAA